jgi:hypothetical protein
MMRGHKTAAWMQHATTAAQAACPWTAIAKSALDPIAAAGRIDGFFAMTSARSGARSIHTIDPRTGRGGSLGRRLYV